MATVSLAGDSVVAQLSVMNDVCVGIARATNLSAEIIN